MKKNSLLIRLSIIGVLTLGFVGLSVYKLYSLQIVHGEDYKEKTEQSLTGNSPIYSARGEILDRNGEKLITNTTSFVISLQKNKLATETQNDIVLKLINLFEQYNVEYKNNLPISIIDGSYIFSENSDSMFSFIEKKQSSAKTPDEVVDFFIERYNISRELTDQEILNIASVRYQMEQDLFSSVTDYIFAENASQEIVSTILENEAEFFGVSVDLKPVREYSTAYAAHILGRTGKIQSDEVDYYRDLGYKLNAIVGIDGLEEYLEPYIRATDGVKPQELFVDGELVVSGEEIPAIPGNNAVLTLDLDLQKVAEESLARTITEIKEKPGATSKTGLDARGGAAVVLDVNTGEVLAIASYPTYNLSTFNQDFATLNTDPLTPMVNRATYGTYAPGSTYKMVTTIAGLEEAVVSTSTRLVCNGPYTYYSPSYTPACWIYNYYGGSHGSLEVTEALKVSCNCYYYEVGRLLGGQAQEDYAKMLGLGQKTGIETGESSRTIVAGPTSREIMGGIWQPGDSLQSAIGQSDHLYTPVQLANYVATIANGGTLNEVHLLKSIESFDYSETIMENNPEPINELDISEETLDAVFEGMNNVVSEVGGSAAYLFYDYPIEIAAKTGTAESYGNTVNGVFVSFAPFDEPEIAVCIVGEGVGSSSSLLGTVVRDIYDEYFGLNVATEPTE